MVGEGWFWSYIDPEMIVRNSTPARSYFFLCLFYLPITTITLFVKLTFHFAPTFSVRWLDIRRKVLMSATLLEVTN